MSDILFIENQERLVEALSSKPKNLKRRSTVSFICTKCGKEDSALVQTLLRSGFLCINCKCKIAAERSREKREKTMLERYGVKYPGNSKIIRERKIKTNLAKYGVKSTLCLKSIQEKCKKTKLEKYGNMCGNLEKFKQTCLDRYGTTSPLLNKEVKAKSDRTMIEKYGYTNALKNKDCMNKCKQTKLDRYGDENYNNQDQAKKTRLEKYGYEYSLQVPEISAKCRKKIERFGLYFDSQAEVKVYEFCMNKNIPVTYRPCTFKYEDSFGKSHQYFPDFEINGKLYEIKGDFLWRDEKLYFPYRNRLSDEELKKLDARDEAKTECMLEHEVTIVLSSNIDEFLNSLLDRYATQLKDL
jgi:hypothetical protein